MAEEPRWHYEKLEENGRVKYAPMNDADGKITGRHVFGLKAWFDENPEERKRLGWIKHITHKTKDIEYDKATQYLVNAPIRIDEWTIEDNWQIMNMSEEQMRLVELGGAGALGWNSDAEIDTWGVDDT